VLLLGLHAQQGARLDSIGGNLVRGQGRLAGEREVTVTSSDGQVRRLLVLGGGVVGCEMARACHDLGPSR
jgi:NADPH-dependent 2,4-dienoyl-CoA reductase/sulfur reductase-like enzyme